MTGATERGAAPAAPVVDLVELLRSLEWSGTDGHSQGGYVSACPSCSGTKPGSGDPEYEGHADGCTLAAVLAGFAAPPDYWSGGTPRDLLAAITPGDWKVGQHHSELHRGPTRYQVFVDSADLLDETKRAPCILARTMTDDWHDHDGPTYPQARANADAIALLPRLLLVVETVRTLLDGREWEAGDLDKITDALRNLLGVLIRDPSEVQP